MFFRANRQATASLSVGAVRNNIVDDELKKKEAPLVSLEPSTSPHQSGVTITVSGIVRQNYSPIVSDFNCVFTLS